ncbi:hypothetical protein BGW42_006852 [Actinomortierella wolfii]|nr:hypothetical protein BGW42_006852 [Actinomortierella wolfii]
MELDSRDEAEESDVNRHLPTNGQEGDRNSVGPRKPAKNLYTCPGKGLKIERHGCNAQIEKEMESVREPPSNFQQARPTLFMHEQ